MIGGGGRYRPPTLVNGTRGSMMMMMMMMIFTYTNIETSDIDFSGYHVDSRFHSSRGPWVMDPNHREITELYCIIKFSVVCMHCREYK